jgi:hypothetical protein
MICTRHLKKNTFLHVQSKLYLMNLAFDQMHTYYKRTIFLMLCNVIITIEWYRFYELGGSCVPPWGGTLMSVSSLANTDTTWSNSLEMVVCSPWPGKMFRMYPWSSLCQSNISSLGWNIWLTQGRSWIHSEHFAWPRATNNHF